jgi:hypothetical protein
LENNKAIIKRDDKIKKGLNYTLVTWFTLEVLTFLLNRSLEHNYFSNQKGIKFQKMQIVGIEVKSTSVFLLPTRSKTSRANLVESLPSSLEYNRIVLYSSFMKKAEIENIMTYV